MKKFYPVIHCFDGAIDNKNIKTAIDNGADGIFLINHGVLSDYSFELSVRNACARYKIFTKIGANFLNLSNIEALEKAVDFGLDMLWVDNGGFDQHQDYFIPNEFFYKACELDDFNKIDIFAGIHFKYQAQPTASIEDSVKNCLLSSFVPTISGPATGKSASVEFVQRTFAALEEHNKGFWPEKGRDKIAIASGITVENVNNYLPYINYFLVASSILDKNDKRLFDEEKLKMLCDKIHSFGENL
jgi:hypothetical protein